MAALMREFAEKGGLREVLVNVDRPYEREDAKRRNTGDGRYEATNPF